MGHQDVKQSAQQLFELNQAWWEILPFQRSIIPTDIGLTVAHFALSEMPLTMRRLVAELPHSEAGIKQYLRQMEEEGWIARRQDPVDARAVNLEPTHDLLSIIEALSGRVAGIFAPPPPNIKTIFKSKNQS